MNRKDSGCEAPSFSQFSNKETITFQRINTSSTRRHKSDPSTTIQSEDMDEQRQSLESRSRPSKQDSTTSSSEHSGSRSKGRGHSSKPSSHRTSFTIVDPSRPARHYRVRSSHAVPTANGHDIDDALALHFRSYNLFTNPTYQSNSRLPSPTTPQADGSAFPSPALPITSDATVSEKTMMPKPSEETIAAAEQMNMTMHWTSPSTRRQEYERIDRKNRGLRGLFRKVTPRCVSGPPEKFYEKDQSDTGSVRRYRLDDVDDTINEKELLKARASTCDESKSTKKRFLCF